MAVTASTAKTGFPAAALKEELKVLRIRDWHGMGQGARFVL